MSDKLIHEVKAVAFHRNGVAGAPFYVVLFTIPADADIADMVGVVFDPQNEGRVAVFDVALLAAGIITFGRNSWRGDRYEAELWDAIETYESERA